MKKLPLKIVLVEDVDEDVVLMRRVLERAGLKTEIRTVCTAKELREALNEDEWDAILSDYNLPRMNGLDALRIRKDVCPRTPFIVVTGSIGEESAIELMKAGADDYIIKSNIKRLPTAVRQAVRTAAVRRGKRHAQSLLKRTKIMLEGIANGIEDRLFLISPTYRILWANQAVLRDLGRGLADIRGRACHEILFHRGVPCTPPVANCPFHSGPEGGAGSSVYLLGGRTFEVKAYPLKFGARKAPFFIHVSRDISRLQESRAESVRNLNRLQKLLRNTIEALSGTMELRDPYTAGHQKKVSRLATAVARELGVDQRAIDGIYMAGIVHDLGKVAVPTEILTKPSLLDQNEFAIIKTHPRIGYDILKNIDFPWPVAQAVLEHHERLNGSGYPAGLREDGICLEAKIIAVADVVEAIASDRPYRPGLGIDKALEEIEKNKGTLFDPRSVEACLRLCREKGFTFAGD
ncbi:MAG: HD domain-containing protein [Spirochaetales bacterium]|nr:HD domain-containing protein [Spirochaetales bacterium]